MKLQIDRLYVESMVAALPDLAPPKDQLRFGKKV